MCPTICAVWLCFKKFVRYLPGDLNVLFYHSFASGQLQCAPFMWCRDQGKDLLHAQGSSLKTVDGMDRGDFWSPLWAVILKTDKQTIPSVFRSLNSPILSVTAKNLSLIIWSTIIPCPLLLNTRLAAQLRCEKSQRAIFRRLRLCTRSLQDPLIAEKHF